VPCKKLDCQREEKVIRRIIKFYMVDIKVTDEFGRGVYISKHIMDNLFDFEPKMKECVKLWLNLNITI